MDIKELEAQVILGEKKELLDQETGEIIVVDQISKKYMAEKIFGKCT